MSGAAGGDSRGAIGGNLPASQPKFPILDLGGISTELLTETLDYTTTAKTQIEIAGENSPRQLP